MTLTLVYLKTRQTPSATEMRVKVKTQVYMIRPVAGLKLQTNPPPLLPTLKVARHLHGQTLMMPPSRFRSHLLPAYASYAMHRKRTLSKGWSMNGDYDDSL